MALDPDVLYGSVQNDPDFLKAPPAAKAEYFRRILPTLDPDFAKASADDQLKYIQNYVMPGLDAPQQAPPQQPPLNPLMDGLQALNVGTKKAATAIEGFTDPYLNSASFGLYDKASEALGNALLPSVQGTRAQRKLKMLQMDEQSMGLKPGELTGIYNSPWASVPGDLAGMVQPASVLENLAGRGLYRAGARIPSLFTSVGAPRLATKMITGGLGVGTYDGLKNMVTKAPEAGFNAGQHAQNFGEGFMRGAPIGAALPLGFAGLGKVWTAANPVLKAGVKAFSGKPAAIGLGKKVSPGLMNEAERTLGAFRQMADDLRAGNLVAREQDFADIAEVINGLESHAMGGGVTPVGQLLSKARNVNRRMARQNKPSMLEEINTKLDNIDNALEGGIIRLAPNGIKRLGQIKKAVKSGRYTDAQVNPLKAIMKDLDEIAIAAEKARIKAEGKLKPDTGISPQSGMSPVEPSLSAGDSFSAEGGTLKAGIEKVAEVDAKIKALKEDPRLAQAETMRESVKGQRTPEARAVREEADALTASVKKEKAALREELNALDPEGNMRIVARAEAETGSPGVQMPLDETSLTYDDIVDILPTELKAKAKKLAEVMKQDAAVKVEYVAEIVGRSEGAASVTNKGNVKVLPTEFTPTSFGRVTKVIEKDTGKVLDKRLKGTSAKLEAGEAIEKEFVTVKGYEERGHEVLYYLSESPEGSQLIKVGNILEGKAFRGTTPNVYQGQRTYNPEDVLARGPRTEQGYIKTSEAISSLKVIQDLYSKEVMSSLSKPVQVTLKKIKKTGRLNPQDVTELRRLLESSRKELDRICSITGLN